MLKRQHKNNFKYCQNSIDFTRITMYNITINIIEMFNTYEWFDEQKELCQHSLYV